MNQKSNILEITKLSNMSHISQAPPLENIKLYQLIDSLTKKVDHLEKTIYDLQVKSKKMPSKKHILHCLNDIEKG